MAAYLTLPSPLVLFFWYWNFVVICYQFNFQYILTKGLGPERSWIICLISSTHWYIHIVCKLNAILLIKIHFNYQMALLSIHLYMCPRCDQVPLKAISNKKYRPTNHLQRPEWSKRVKRDCPRGTCAQFLTWRPYYYNRPLHKKKLTNPTAPHKKEILRLA